MGQTIKRGQRLTSYSHLAEETSLSIQNVRTSLSKLKSTHELTIKTSSKNTIITVLNYDQHQETNTPTNKRLTNNQQTTNNKQECKKEKNEKKENTSLKKKHSVSSLNKPSNKTKPSGILNSSIKILLEEKTLLELSTKFNLSTSSVKYEVEKMTDWLKSSGKTYKDYKAFARGWLRRNQESLNGNGESTVKKRSLNI